MFLSYKSILLGCCYLTPLFLCFDIQPISAYVAVPRSTADTTEKMNTGGDPPDRPGLIDEQKSPEYLDDWWGVKDDYYLNYGRQRTGTIRHPTYSTENPPYYPYPNTDYYPYQNNPHYYHNAKYYDYNTRYYRPDYPR